ncbi:DUF6942 family protein [Pseudoalteromonas luteoviolacea]|uniref:Uncharacterized protein n=1 Tax=Pseudoalteromonas luteoviolacea S4054 TaxID=1129367 RepID=A0A0F6A9H8_9GAMM|nr:hypothetical protein [Pseudoalteromonas luteoviolacea]AOT10802.1 hypothetical protein S4054249_23410 [Pseudoalteromonas luteoviolacea]AOT16035.1 hypothetical protein S40542_25095 [Pseudoalteromonas luteoviolacea]AOT20623.1 hypothetical protein S4054_23330 [Pseudoalteromonas luteoviolacea]KKE82842.1 hypothetical protein N479_16350 [Pseudoalteromonas luteoviolacea S4054]KZN75276.1 hypothetical protein N481_08130 [Pseudoalteromonas luteoviolacea S4047-1]
MKILTHGFGASHGILAVYVENRPNLVKYKNINYVMPLQPGEIDYINQECGNGWRKLFNVYSKFIAELQHPDHHFTNGAHTAQTWQQYRDSTLLQAASQEALLFSPPDLAQNNYQWHIIAGRTYAKQLLKDHDLTHSIVWLDEEFAIDNVNKIIVCPYFDYRQLSNIKITKLVTLIKTNLN